MADQKHHEEIELSVSLLPATTEQERDLAQRANAEFDKGEYESCLSMISRLAETRGHDLKVIHNQAVAAYYKSGMTRTDEFKSALNDVYSKVSLDEIAALDDVDQCIIYYNHAVVLYYTKQYKAAFGLLDKVMHFIEPMDENVSRKVTFLMVELYLAIHQPYKALQMVTFIEKSQIGSSKSSSPDKDREDAGREVKEGSNSDQTSESWKAAISQYKVRCYLMMKSIKSCKREMKALVGSAGSTVSMTFLKSQLEYMRGNVQKAIRVLCSVSAQVLNAPRCSPSLGQCLGRNAAAMYYNNLGVLHFHMRKHNLGLFYLRRALDENNSTMLAEQSRQTGVPLCKLGLSRYYEIMYNLGVQLLHCGQPQAAFDCLLETVQQFQVNPYLWLRLAECCIMVQRPNNDVERSHAKKMEVISGAVGSGLHRKLILGSGVRLDKLSAVLESMAIPMASMEFAALCLDNALLLLPDTTSSTQPSTAEGQSETRSSTDAILLPAPPGNPLKSDDIASLRCSVLACRAYVALYHRDYLVALKFSQKLMRQPRLSGAHKYLGHMYMAEALVALDRIADSIDHLNPDLVNDIDQKLEQDKSEKNGDTDVPDQTEFKGARYPWSPANVVQAKAIMVYNLAVTHTMRGEHDKGLLNLEKITQSIGHPRPAQMYYLKIYLELLEGHRKVLQNVFRDHFGHISSAR